MSSFEDQIKKAMDCNEHMHSVPNGDEICFNNQVKNLQSLMTKECIDIIEQCVKAVGEDEYEKGMQGDDKLMTQYGDYIRQEIRERIVAITATKEKLRKLK